MKSFFEAVGLILAIALIVFVVWRSIVDPCTMPASSIPANVLAECLNNQ